MKTKRHLPIGLAGGLALIAVCSQKFVHRTAKEEAMRGVNARTREVSVFREGVWSNGNTRRAGQVPRSRQGVGV